MFSQTTAKVGTQWHALALTVAFWGLPMTSRKSCKTGRNHLRLSGLRWEKGLTLVNRDQPGSERNKPQQRWKQT